MTVKSKIMAVIASLLLAFSLSVPALASPAQQEKVQFCETVAKNWQAGADARKLNMTVEELESRIVVFAMNLLQNGFPEPIIHMLVQPIVDGYFGQSSAEAHFKSCMGKEMI